jgi:hypothetical protein
MGRTRQVAILAAAAAVTAIAAPAALADGLPVAGVDASFSGVGSLDGSVRFVTVPGPTGTTVARVTQRGGQLQATKFIRGTFSIPAVAYDGSASGLSADGKRLVLITPRPSFPRARTTFAVLKAKRGFGPPRIERLRGDFSFDAISPDGRWMYLIEYTSPANPTRYRVRAYDLDRHRLVGGPIVDAREPDEKMQGIPATRTMSPDGRWAYTLYERTDGGAPFVHALDTSRRTARCIDLEPMTGQPAQGNTLKVSSDAQQLTVGNQTSPKAVIDLTTFAVSAPAVIPAQAVQAGGGDRNIWPLAAAGGLVALLGVFTVGRLRRSRAHQTA